MMVIKALTGLLAAAGLAGAVEASAPQAWAEMEARVDRACLRAAGLQRAKIVPDKASFPDRVPVELRIVEGYNSGGVVDVQLCIYDRTTRRAALAPGVGRLGVNRR